MIGKKINQLATELAPLPTDLTIIGDPTTGVSKKITLEQISSLFGGSVSFYTNLAGFPAVGNIDIIYCAKNTNKLYLWSGSAYVEMFPSQALLDTYQLRSEKGNANGYASLDNQGKVPISQLPSSIMEYKGTWNASTNTPTLANGTGDTGDVYICNVAGTVNFGAGPLTFAVGDYVIYSGTIWQRSSGAVGTVTSVAVSRSGDALAITGSPVTTSGTINIGFAGTSGEYINGAGNRTTFPTLLSSVGLSMPSAFNVANSPLTANGTIAVTGAGNATQYVRGDGQLATLPTNGGGGGASVSYYLNGSINQGTIGGVTYYEMNKTPIIDAGTDFTRSSNGYIASFLTDANDPALLNIPAGNFNFETYFEASSGGGSPTFYIELYKYDGTTFTLIASNSGSPKLINDGTNIEAYFSALAVPQTTLTLTDRLAIRIYVTTAGRTITLHTENGHLCQVITTFTTGLTALNGLTAQVQYLATGTSGTDFNISSATATHTFNLPTASATNRGALASADWTTFNNKQNALNGTGFVKISGTTISYDNSTYYLASNPNAYIPLTALSAGAGISYNNTTGVIASTITQYTDANARAAISETVTGLDYNNTTGVLSLTSGYVIPTTTNETNWNAAYNDKINSAAVTGTTTKTLTLTQQDGGTITASWTDINTDAVTSVFGRTGAVVATSGDYNTSQVTENTNLYFTNARAIASTLTGYTSGAGTISSSDSILSAIQKLNGNIGALTTGVSSVNGLTGAVTLTTSNIAEGTNLYYTEARVSANTNVAANTAARHNAVTIGTANGLSLSTQVLSLALASGSTTGALSSTDWTTFNNKQNALTNPVTGTGTNNYLPKFTGTSTIGNSQVIDDGDGVGIGLISPQYKLHVVSSSTSISAFRNSGASAGQILVGNTVADLGLRILASGDSLIYSDTSKYLAFGTNGATEKMRLNASGNLGLGVTPSAWGGSYKAVQISNSALWAATNDLHLTLNTLYDGAYKYIDSGHATRYNQYLGQHIWYNAPSGTAGNAISFTQAMTLNASGNLSVGNTNDSFKLDVTGTGRFTGTDGTRVLEISTGGATFTRINGSRGNANDLHVGNLEFYNTNSSRIIGEIRAITGTGGTQSNSGQLAFYTNNNGSYAERFRIASTGAATFSSSVTAKGFINDTATGISSSGGMFRLSNGYTYFVGSSTDNGAILGNGAGTATVQALSPSGSTGYLVFETGAGSERMRITSAGLLGIGTTAPNSLLEVNRTITFSSIDTYAQLVVKTTSGANGKLLNIGVDETNSVSFIQSLNRGTDVMPLSLQRYGGAVLIGTTTEGFLGKLQVAGSVAITGQYNTVLPSSSFSYFDGSGQVVSSSSNASALYLDTTWNTTGNPDGIYLNVTNTASGSSSKLMNLKVGSVSQFSVSKAGAIQTTAPSSGSAQPWKLGSYAAGGTGTATGVIYIEINGQIYSIPALQGTP
jgi:hypothetical protein